MISYMSSKITEKTKKKEVAKNEKTTAKMRGLFEERSEKGRGRRKWKPMENKLQK